MKESVTRWGPIIEAEIIRGEYPFPRELIFSIINVESSGKAGIVNSSSGASGLMQVMPVTLDSYNKAHSEKIPMSLLRNSDRAAEQIRVGLWILGLYWRSAYKFLQPKLQTVPVDQLVRIADLFYSAGPGKAKPMLNALPSPTFEAFENQYPNSNMTTHATRVWTQTEDQKPTWNLNAIDKWVSGNAIIPLIARTNPAIGFVIAALLITAVYYFFMKKPPKKSE